MPMIERVRHGAAVAVAAIAMLAACGRNTPAGGAGTAASGPPAASPALPPPSAAQPSTTMQLTPLGDADVKLYLDVMEAAADRIVHPTAEDQQTTARANKAMMSAKPGQALPPDDGRAMIRFTTMMTNMDLIVAEERRVDVKRYEGIRAIVEDVVPNPAMINAPGMPAAAAPAPADPRTKNAEEAAAKVLEPYKARIQRVEAIVRKSSRLAR